MIYDASRYEDNGRVAICVRMYSCVLCQQVRSICTYECLIGTSIKCHVYLIVASYTVAMCIQGILKL